MLDAEQSVAWSRCEFHRVKRRVSLAMEMKGRKKKEGTGTWRMRESFRVLGRFDGARARAP